MNGLIDGPEDAVGCDVTLVLSWTEEREDASRAMAEFVEWVRGRVKEEHPGVVFAAIQTNMAELEEGDA